MLIIAFAFTNTRVPRYEPIDYGCSRFDVPEAESPYVAPLRILNGDYVPLCSIVFYNVPLASLAEHRYLSAIRLLTATKL